MPENEVNFTSAGTEIRGEKFKADRLQMFPGGAFAQFTAPQMFRFLVATPPRLELFPETHSASLKSSGAAAFFKGAKVRRWMGVGP